MSFMPLNTATALPTKAALAQGGFFTFEDLFSFDFNLTSTTSQTHHAIASRPQQARRPSVPGRL
jgi:hypothetical protein